MKLDYNFFDFQTNYQSPSEKFSDGDFSYGDGLIGITILGPGGSYYYFTSKHRCQESGQFCILYPVNNSKRSSASPFQVVDNQGILFERILSYGEFVLLTRNAL